MSIRLVPPRKGRSKNWRIRGTYLRVYIDESTGAYRKPIAEAYLKRCEREIEGGLTGRKPESTFAVAAIGYLKSCPDGEVKYIKKLLEHFGETPLSEINQAAIDGCVDALYAARKPGTINRNCLVPLAAVLHHAAGRDLCAWIRVKKLREPKGRNRWITPEEAERLIEASSPKLRPLVVFLFATGCRLGEAIRLDWNDVDLLARKAALVDTKNGETYGVPLHERAFLEMANLTHRTGLVFGYQNRWAVRRHWRVACRRAGIENFTPHCARHTFATWLRQQGIDLRALMEVGRWKDQKSVGRYAHVSVEEQRTAIDNLPLTRGKSVESGNGSR